MNKKELLHCAVVLEFLKGSIPYAKELKRLDAQVVSYCNRVHFAETPLVDSYPETTLRMYIGGMFTGDAPNTTLGHLKDNITDKYLRKSGVPDELLNLYLQFPVLWFRYCITGGIKCSVAPVVVSTPRDGRVIVKETFELTLR